jgi:hypothetical protein
MSPASYPEVIFGWSLTVNFEVLLNFPYSQTCTQRPPSGPKTGGRCSEVASCYKDLNWDSKTVVAAERWSLFGGGRWLMFDCIALNKVNISKSIVRFFSVHHFD